MIERSENQTRFRSRVPTCRLSIHGAKVVPRQRGGGENLLCDRRPALSRARVEDCRGALGELAASSDCRDFDDDAAYADENRGGFPTSLASEDFSASFLHAALT